MLLMLHKYNENLLQTFHCHKNVYLPSQHFVLVSRYFSLYTGSLPYPFLVPLLTLTRVYHNKFKSRIKNHALSFIKIFSISTHFGWHYTKQYIFLNNFLTNKVFKFLFAKTNLLIYYYSLSIHIFVSSRYLGKKNLHFSIPVSPNFKTFIFIFWTICDKNLS